MGEKDIGEYEIHVYIKGQRSNGHFLAKDIENSCDLARRYLDLEIECKLTRKK